MKSRIQLHRSAAAGLLPVMIVALLGISACTPLGAAVGAGASVGVAGSEERGFRNAANDTAIAVGIKTRLLNQSPGMFALIGVAVVEGRVLLTGSVKTQAERDLAERIAYQADSVRQVLNEIQVNDSGLFDFARDQRIIAELRTQMLSDKQIADINYSIDSQNAVLYLIGIARDQQEVDRVISYARNIKSVRRIVNYVITRNDPGRPPG